jgi:hypothetical protein
MRQHPPRPTAAGVRCRLQNYRTPTPPSSVWAALARLDHPGPPRHRPRAPSTLCRPWSSPSAPHRSRLRQWVRSMCVRGHHSATRRAQAAAGALRRWRCVQTAPSALPPAAVCLGGASARSLSCALALHSRHAGVIQRSGLSVLHSRPAIWHAPVQVLIGICWDRREMSSPSSPSCGGSIAGSEPPPAAAAASVSVPDLQRRHPLWERAAGRDGGGSGAGGAGGAGGGVPPPPSRRGAGAAGPPGADGEKPP